LIEGIFWAWIKYAWPAVQDGRQVTRVLLVTGHLETIGLLFSEFKQREQQNNGYK